MTAPFDPAEYKFVQLMTATSAADALYVGLPEVPVNTLWTVRAATVRPSAAETRLFWFSVQGAGWPAAIPITWPTSLAAGTTNPSAAFTKEGMEFTLGPGERLYAHRDTATAGSTITLLAAIVVHDLPIYRYTEPLLEDRKKKQFADIIAGRGRFFRGRGGGGSLPGLMPGGGGPVPRPK